MVFELCPNKTLKNSDSTVSSAEEYKSLSLVSGISANIYTSSLHGDESRYRDGQLISD